MEQEKVYVAAFTSAATFRLVDDRLELQDATGETVLVYARVPPPTAESVLPGTQWELTSLRGQPLLPGTHINLEFGEQPFSGFSGCNYYGGGPDSGKYAAADDGALKILEFAVTAIGCPEGIMAQEKAYIDALMSPAAYQPSDDRLEIQNAAGETVLVYARRAECAEIRTCQFEYAGVDGY